MSGQLGADAPDTMCVAIADDDPELLDFVAGWVSDLPKAQLLVCRQLDNFRTAILEKLQSMRDMHNAIIHDPQDKIRILIFLDLIWGPGHNPARGLECLNTLRNDPELRCYPIIIYSQTNGDDEIAQCYCRQASGFLTKGPHNGLGAGERFISVVETWRTIMTLPPARDS